MNTISLYQFVDFDFDKFIGKYLHEITEHTETHLSEYAKWQIQKGKIAPDMVVEIDDGTFSQVSYNAKRGVKDENKIKWKIQYLQDVIIRRASSKKHGAFSLNSQVLKAVIGDEYKVMLYILREMGYLILGDGKNGQTVNKYYYYEWGGYSTIYSLPKDKVVEIVDITNVTIKKYISKE
jgi:hypothetical protein